MSTTASDYGSLEGFVPLSHKALETVTALITNVNPLFLSLRVTRILRCAHVLLDGQFV